MHLKQKLQSGITLVELLVSMLIAGIIFSGVVSVVQLSQRNFVAEQENSFIQENARFAVEVLTRDIRMAGSMGCANSSQAYLSNVVDGDVDGLLSLDAIVGFEGSSGINAAVWPDAFETGATPGSDAVILRYADPDSSLYIQDHTNYTSATFQLHSSHSWQEGDKLMIVDSSCRQVGLFEATAGTTSVLNHNTGAGTPGNCTRVLFNTNSSTPITCSSSPCNPTSCGGVAAAPFGNGANVMSFISNGYYIGDSNVIPGVPALKRQVLTSAGSRAEELAQGIEDMELLFGVSTEMDGAVPDPDADVDAFLRADEVVNWDSVIAVRLLLVMRSLSEVYEENRAVTINGVNYADRFLRQMTTATVRIRNRG